MEILEECGAYTILLAIVGVLTIFSLLLETLWALIQGSRAILAPYLLANEEENLVKKFGSWALVTGCTDGIGKEYSKQLARRGLNLVLVSRSEEKLMKTASEIQIENPGIKTKIIVADFSKGSPIIEHIKSEVGKIPVGILVNNVGTQYAYPMYVDEVPEETLWDIININVGAVTLLTRAFLGEMKNRGKGAIVNVSSGSELQPLPLMTVYAASKVYVKSFTEALRYEYADQGITIQHLSPMFINTKMNHFSDRLQETTWLVPDAQSFAKYAVATLGKVDHSTGYWSHGIQYFFTSLVPVWVRMHIGGHLNKGFRKDYFSNMKKAKA